MDTTWTSSALRSLRLSSHRQRSTSCSIFRGGGAFGFVRAQRFTSVKLCFIEGAALRICPRRRGGGEDTADSLWSGLNVIESGQKWKSLAAAADERGDGSGRRTLNT